MISGPTGTREMPATVDSALSLPTVAAEDVLRACEGSECVWHIAALVGPYHPLDMYMRVNYDGTVNVIDACKSLGIRKIVMSSSPSTRFHGGDINGAKESELVSQLILGAPECVHALDPRPSTSAATWRRMKARKRSSMQGPTGSKLAWVPDPSARHGWSLVWVCHRSPRCVTLRP